jgi:hypothetical protein
MEEEDAMSAVVVYGEHLQQQQQQKNEKTVRGENVEFEE